MQMMIQRMQRMIWIGWKCRFHVIIVDIVVVDIVVAIAIAVAVAVAVALDNSKTLTRRGGLKCSGEYGHPQSHGGY